MAFSIEENQKLNPDRVYFVIEDSKLINGSCVVIMKQEHYPRVRGCGLPVFTMGEICALSATPEALGRLIELKKVFGDIWLVRDGSDLLPPDEEFAKTVMPLLRRSI